MTQTDKSGMEASEAPAAAPTALSGQLFTTFNHRSFTLIGTTFLVFECFFLSLYGGNFWFGTDISWLGIPAIITSALVSHFLLRWVESPSGSVFFSPIWKGSPPTIYWRLAVATDSTINYGARLIRWEAIDELELSFFGNLLVYSRSICGPLAAKADLVVKMPVGALSPDSQRSLVAALRARKPELKTNHRLEKRLAKHDLKGAALVQSFGVIFMVAILLDLGQSTFRFLQMNKEYYLAQVQAGYGKLDEAKAHLARADELYNHPFQPSWVNTKLIGQGVVAAGLHQLRSEALWELGRKDEAIEEQKKAVKCSPDSFRLNLRLARLLEDKGDLVGSHEQIRLAIKNHKDSFLPRLYMLAELASTRDEERVSRFYQLYLDDITDTVFGDEPWWPPGGNRYLHELFFSDDVTFIFDRLLHHPYEKRKPEEPDKN